MFHWRKKMYHIWNYTKKAHFIKEKGPFFHHSSMVYVSVFDFAACLNSLHVMP